MKRRVQSEDISTIKYWADKGLSTKDICDITGWSKATVARARKGEDSYYADREARRVDQAARSQKQSVNEESSTTVVTNEVEQYSLEDVIKLLQVQNNLISQLTEHLLYFHNGKCFPQNIDLWR